MLFIVPSYSASGYIMICRSTRLNGLLVLGRVVHEDARGDEAGVGRSAEDLGDALGHFALPVRADEQIEARRGAVHLAEVDEAVGAQINGLIDPEAVAEVGHLDDDRGLVESQRARRHRRRPGSGRRRCALGGDIVGEHDKAVERRGRHRAGIGELRRLSRAASRRL